MMSAEPAGQGWLQVKELALAFVLSALIGLEREIRNKNAGLRTYTLVGFAAALIMLVSKYGFTNVVAADRIVLDPSRVAAQVVSGIGFIGGGLIFVRRDNVRGTDDSGDRLADGVHWNGVRSRAPDTGPRRDGASFRRRLRFSPDRGSFAEISLGAVGLATVLRGRA